MRSNAPLRVFAPAIVLSIESILFAHLDAAQIPVSLFEVARQIPDAVQPFEFVPDLVDLVGVL